MVLSRENSNSAFLSVTCRTSYFQDSYALFAVLRLSPRDDFLHLKSTFSGLKKLPELCQRVSSKLSRRLPPKPSHDFRIKLEKDATSQIRGVHRLYAKEMEELHSQLSDLLQQGFIRYSKRSWGASMLFVRKKTKVSDFLLTIVH